MTDQGIKKFWCVLSMFFSKHGKGISLWNLFENEPPMNYTAFDNTKSNKEKLDNEREFTSCTEFWSQPQLGVWSSL